MSSAARADAMATPPQAPGASLSATARVLEGGSGFLVAAAGELDLRGAPVLREALAGPLREGSGPVLLELADVDFIDSSGLATLLNAQGRLTRVGRRLVLIAPSAPVRRLLSAIGLQDSISSAPSLDDAIGLTELDDDPDPDGATLTPRQSRRAGAG